MASQPPKKGSPSNENHSKIPSKLLASEWCPSCPSRLPSSNSNNSLLEQEKKKDKKNKFKLIRLKVDSKNISFNLGQWY